MGGGSSSSSQKQETTQNELTGVNTGTQTQGVDIQQGQTVFKSGTAQRIEIEKIEQIPESVGAAFTQLIALANDSVKANMNLSTAGQAIISDLSKTSINKVGERAEAATQPDLSTITKLVPVMMIGIVAYALVKGFK